MSHHGLLLQDEAVCVFFFFFCISLLFVRQAINERLFLLKAVIPNGHKSLWEIKRQQKKVISEDRI